NPYYPFANCMDWEVAQWAIDEGPSQGAFTRLLNIEGIQEKLGLSYKDSRSLNQLIDQLPALAHWKKSIITAEGVPGEHELFFQDPIDCIKAIYSNPAFLDHMRFSPEQHFTDKEKLHRTINEMMTADWVWKTQEKLPKGDTLVPVILSSDKTQLTVFNGDCTAYPVYITLGVIDSAIRRKPSYGAQMLLGYLPASMDDGDLGEEDARLAHSRLFHCGMSKILESLKGSTAKDGIELTSADGAVRRCHLVVSCYVADYPEQCLVTCTRQGRTCPKCKVTWSELGSGIQRETRKQEETLKTLRHAQKLGSSRKAQEALKDQGLNFVPEPFYAGLPFTCIHEAITSDVLHQIFQGLEDHLIEWMKILMTDAELDARFKRLPPMHGMRTFKDGISKLTNISAKEHKEMCKQFLGCIINCPDIPVAAVQASRGLLDFIHLAQYKSHSPETLDELEAALEKLCIQLFGTTDNYNTETTERHHIDFAKEAYRATNKKDYFDQMTIWLEWREKVKAFGVVLQWRQGRMPVPRMKRRRRNLTPGIQALAKAPSAPKVTFKDLEEKHGAMRFEGALKTYIAQYRDHANPGRRARRADSDIQLPFSAVDVWYRVKFAVPDLHMETEGPTLHSAHAEPARTSLGKRLPERFDTVLVNETDESEERGMKGKRVAQLRVIFTIPADDLAVIFGSRREAPGPLAYVEWFTRARDKDPNHLMFPISRSRDVRGNRISSIIELDTLFRNCHLFPKFEPRANRAWTSQNVLERCDRFYINDCADHHSYQTIW
ncbi:hypothetical protein GLOTRDRAFT_24981, partial [Gloeophyllum trabeum ATCC 11539]